MTKRSTKTPTDETTPHAGAQPDETYKAHAAHTLAQMLLRRIAPAAATAPTALWTPPMSAYPQPSYVPLYANAWPASCGAWQPTLPQVAQPTVLYWYP